jgi:small subunit ribosomal protein S2
MTVAELPSFTMRQLLEAGVHFGHQTHRWNPKMDPYIYGARNNIHIMDLRETVPMLHQALTNVRDVISGGGRLLFVGTKRQASTMVASAAQRCGQYYVNHRWLGGMLTNWKTISNSIRRLRVLEEQLEGEEDLGLTKKELLRLTRERDKLDRALGGIKDMGGLPDMLFVIDTVKEQIALKEAIKLGIPVVAVVDSNADPEEVTYPVPGNDDAARAIELYLDLVSRAVLAGLQREQQESGVDIGASADLVGQIPAAPAPEEAPAEAAAEATEAAPEAAAEPEAPAEPEAAAEAEPVPEAAAEPTTEAEPADETKPAAGE